MPYNFLAPDHCPRAEDKPEVIDFRTGELGPAMCRANFCPYCGWSKRGQIGRAVGAAEPKHFLTFTSVGDEWPVIQRRMNRIAERVRKLGHRFQWAWKVECSTGWKHHHHAHVYVHGDELPGDTVWASHAERVGFGQEFEFLVLNSQPSKAPAYCWGTSTKTYERSPLRLPHVLVMNGGKFVHASREFWRVNGKPVAGLKEAIKKSRGGSPR